MTCKECIHYVVCKIWCGEANIPMSTDCDFSKNKADFVKVVRCRDCNRARSLIFKGFYKCSRHRACRKADDFCSYGKRRDA